MGTRADFYVGRGKQAEWLGSIAFDGYPDGIASPVDRRGSRTWERIIFKAKTEATFRKRVEAFLKDRDDATFPKDGWPWPWEDSNTTDYSYAFCPLKRKVYGSCFGHNWFSCFPLREPNDYEHDNSHQEFPNMKDKQKVTLGKRSGLMVIGPDGPED